MQATDISKFNKHMSILYVLGFKMYILYGVIKVEAIKINNLLETLF